MFFKKLWQCNNRLVFLKSSPQFVTVRVAGCSLLNEYIYTPVHTSLKKHLMFYSLVTESLKISFNKLVMTHFFSLPVCF